VALNEIASAIYEAGGGPESGLQQRGLARLGHPTTNQIPADEDTGIPGSVWCHAYGAPYALPGEETDGREDDAIAPFVAILPLELRNNIPMIPGNLVETVRRGNHLVITGTMPEEANTYVGKEALQPAPEPIERWQLQYLTVRPNNPPDMGLTLVGGVVRVGDTLYSLPNRPISDLSAYLVGIEEGEAKALLIAMNVTTLAIVIYENDVPADNISAGVSDHHALFSDYPQTLASSEERALQYVKLYKDMTQIVTEDLYPVLDVGDGGGGGAVDATDVTYTPGDATDWDSDTDPGDVDDALDQLATRVSDLEDVGGGSVYSGAKVEYQPGSGWFEIDPFDVWQVAWNLTALWDTDLYFNNATSNILTVPEDGYYELFARMECVLLDTTAVTTYVDMYLYAAFDEGGTGSGLPGGRTRGYIPSGVEDDVVMEVHARGDLLLATDPVVKLYIYNQTDVSLQVRFAELVIERKSAPRA
jgi:hypothetical protein